MHLRKDHRLYTQFGEDVAAAFLCSLRCPADKQRLEIRGHVPGQVSQIVSGAAQIEAVIDVKDAGHVDRRAEGRPRPEIGIGREEL